jgi:hypothetical protein
MQALANGHASTRKWTCKHSQMDMQARANGHASTRKWTCKHAQMDMQALTSLLDEPVDCPASLPAKFFAEASLSELPNDLSPAYKETKYTLTHFPAN